MRRAPAGGPRQLAIGRLNAAALAEALAWRPQAVLSAHITTAPAAAAIGRLARVPVVQYFHAREIGARPRLAGFAARARRRPRSRSAPTRANWSSPRADGDDRVHVIHPGVDLPQDAGTRPAAARAGRPTVVTIGRIESGYKGHDVMVGAMAAVRRRLPEARWLVVGDGPLRPRIVALARAAGLDPEAAVFLGALDDRRRDEVLAGADAFAMPSRLPADGRGGEGFGIVYLEAAARGVPVVAGAVGGALDAVADGATGLLVDPEDARRRRRRAAGAARGPGAGAPPSAPPARAGARIRLAAGRRPGRSAARRAGAAMSPVRVLYVNHTARVSGGELSLLGLLERLPLGIEPAVACPPGELAERLRGAGIATIPIRGTDGSLRLHPVRTPQAIGEMAAAGLGTRRAAAEFEADIVHANSIRAGLISLAPVPQRRPPTVVHVRDCLPPGRSTGIVFGMLERAEGLIANSGHTRSGSARSAATPTSSTTRSSSPASPAAASGRAAARARLGLEGDGAGARGDRPGHPLEGQDDAIEIAAALRRSHPGLRLLLIGATKFDAAATRFDNAAYLRRLRRRVELGRLGETVKFLGQREDVPRSCPPSTCCWRPPGRSPSAARSSRRWRRACRSPRPTPAARSRSSTTVAPASCCRRAGRASGRRGSTRCCARPSGSRRWAGRRAPRRIAASVPNATSSGCSRSTAR